MILFYNIQVKSHKQCWPHAGILTYHSGHFIISVKTVTEYLLLYLIFCYFLMIGILQTFNYFLYLKSLSIILYNKFMWSVTMDKYTYYLINCKQMGLINASQRKSTQSVLFSSLTWKSDWGISKALWWTGKI